MDRDRTQVTENVVRILEAMQPFIPIVKWLVFGVLGIAILPYAWRFVSGRYSLDVKKTKRGFHIESTSAAKPQPPEESRSEAARLALRDDPDKKISIRDRESSGDEDEWWALLMEKDYDGALEVLRREQHADPEQAMYWGTLSAFVMFNKDAVEGVAAFEKLLRKYVTNSPPYHLFALSHLEKNQFAEGLEVLDRGISVVEKPDRLINEKASILERTGNHAAAVTLLKDRIDAGATHVPHFLLLARLLIESGKTSSAEVWLLRGLHMRSDSLDIRAALADLLIKDDRNEEALIQYEQLVEEDPQSATYHSLLGNVQLNLDLFDAALDSYEEAERLSEEPQAWIIANIGNLYFRRSLHSRAERYLRRALDVQPDNQYSQKRLTAVLEAKNQESQKMSDMRTEGRSRLTERQVHALPGAGAVGE